MKKNAEKMLTPKRRKTTLRRMQAELDSICVEPNVEARLDRLFDRVGVLYAGDYRAFFEDLDAANPTEVLREADLRIPIEAVSCRMTDD
jgi:predicted glycosyl hydrolase (DUF1957 family)